MSVFIFRVFGLWFPGFRLAGCRVGTVGINHSGIGIATIFLRIDGFRELAGDGGAKSVLP